jgi:hypothetical protein
LFGRLVIGSIEAGKCGGANLRQQVTIGPRRPGRSRAALPAELKVMDPQVLFAHQVAEMRFPGTFARMRTFISAYSAGVQPMMNIRAKLCVLVFSGLALVAVSSVSASARIVCNEDGDCWHAQEDYTFPPGVHVEIHPDNWHWKEGERHDWKEHEGRGYWHGGKWEAF